MQTVRTVIGNAVLVMFMAAASAMAQSPTHKLRGDFAFSGSGVCVNSSAIITPTSYTPPPGFSPNLTPIGPSFVTTFSIQGVLTFNGDGTGGMVARGVFLGNPGAANVQDISAQFNYSVAADRTVTIDQGPTDSVGVAGPGVGGQTRISGFPTFVGRLSSDRNSMTFATFNPGVETLSRLVPGPELVTSVRLCHRARTAIRISQHPGSGGLGED